MYEEKLSEEDDPMLWRFLMECLTGDLRLQLQGFKYKHPLYLKIGCCSHWLRPHQTRWTADGGFAWPSGYGGNEGNSRMGLPELDWSVLYRWVDTAWVPAKKFQGKKRSVLRVAVPARSLRHQQAAVHSLWDMGFPASLDQKLVRFYGLRKKEGVWNITATKDIFL